MFSRCTTELGLKNPFLVPKQLFDKNMFVLSYVSKHSSACPAAKKRSCPGGRGAKKPTRSSIPPIKIPGFVRAERSGPVRFGFIPEEWFKFFYVKTGVTGPYVFGLGVINYMLSKEIYVLEHEYYSGLSIVLIVYFVTTKFGPAIGRSLDEEANAVVASWQSVRDAEKAGFIEQIKVSKDAKWRAESQKLLMDAKKENIAMQFEAIYRERLMNVYQMTKGRMDFQIRMFTTESHIFQKWMIAWVLSNVKKSITPEFQKMALEAAFKDLATATAVKKQ